MKKNFERRKSNSSSSQVKVPELKVFELKSRFMALEELSEWHFRHALEAISSEL